LAESAASDDGLLMRPRKKRTFTSEERTNLDDGAMSVH